MIQFQSKLWHEYQFDHFVQISLKFDLQSQSLHFYIGRHDKSMTYDLQYQIFCNSLPFLETKYWSYPYCKVNSYQICLHKARYQQQFQKLHLHKSNSETKWMIKTLFKFLSLNHSYLKVSNHRVAYINFETIRYLF